MSNMMLKRLGYALIKSLMDVDLYKLTMLQAMLHQMPANLARYEFSCRNEPKISLSRLKDAMDEQLDFLCELRFQPEELNYLATRSYFKSDFIEFLRIFKLNREFITTRVDGDTLRIVAEGPQVHVMYFEIFVLSLINELYTRLGFDEETQTKALAEGERRLKKKIEDFANAMEGVNTRFPLEFFDFGTRRRFSRQWQEYVVLHLMKNPATAPYFKGTSNVYLAMKFGLTPIGTMAHEWLQTFQAMPGVQLRFSQKEALEVWVKEFRGDLGIALTDVIGMDAFLKDFDLYFAKLYDGMRHDSGDKYEWGEKAIAHYLNLRIDTFTKRLVFSDSLEFGAPIVELHSTFADRIRVGAGVGTNLTHDMGAIKPLNVVMKLITCNGSPVAKLSDSKGKTLCTDQVFLNYLRQQFNKPE